jgi:N-acetylmuramoyl-L-alanine amidase
MVVLHYTAMDTAAAALERLCSPEFEVSAHYLIDSDGTIFQMVEESQRAWHAGAGQWGDVIDVNSHSIGIELANTGQTPFAAAQMDALDSLLTGLLERHTISPERVIAHSDMAPHRKNDPGPRFDWPRLVRLGLAVGPQSGADLSTWGSAPDVQLFTAWLKSFGYFAEVEFNSLLTGFRSRFRPRHKGPFDAIDMAIAQDLAARFPVARLSLDQDTPSA